MAPGCVTFQNTNGQITPSENTKQNVIETSSNNTNTDNNSNNNTIPLPPTPPPDNQVTFGESNENNTVDTFEILEQTIIKQKKLAKLKNTDLRKKILLKRTFDLVCEIMDYENGFDDDDDECENENEKRTKQPEINSVEISCSNDAIESKTSSLEKQEIHIIFNTVEQSNVDKTNELSNNDENNKLTLVRLDSIFHNDQLNLHSAKVPNNKRRRSTSDDDDEEQDEYDNYEYQLNDNNYEINDIEGNYFYNFNSNYNNDQQLSCLNSILTNLHDSDLNLYLNLQSDENSISKNFNKNNKSNNSSNSGSKKSKKLKTISI